MFAMPGGPVEGTWCPKSHVIGQIRTANAGVPGAFRGFEACDNVEALLTITTSSFVYNTSRIPIAHWYTVDY